MEIPEDMIITMADVRRHHCVSGLRRWLSQHGYDIRDFMRNGGMNARDMAAIDSLGAAVVEDAIRRRENGDG